MSKQAGKLIWYTDENRPAALRVADALRHWIDRIGKAASWLVLPMIAITALDVLIRKLTWRDEMGQITFGVQRFLVNNVSDLFGSTLLQEMEWHFHTALFVLALAYGYVTNCHVRVDLVRERLSLKAQAWVEIVGITCLLLPFAAVITYFSVNYAYISYVNNEISTSTVGLEHRWAIKSVLVVGFGLILMAGTAVLLQSITILRVDRGRVRFKLMTLEWPEEAGNCIEGKKRILLDEKSERAG